MIAISADSAQALTSSSVNTAEHILDYLDTIRPFWMAQAACRGRSDVMYPKVNPGETRDYSAALTLCDRCPVRAECADWGRHETSGIWGGHVKDRPKHSRSEVFDFLARNPGWWTATQLAARLPVQGRTVHRQLAQLRRDGLVDVVEADGHTGPGYPAAEYRLKGR